MQLIQKSSLLGQKLSDEKTINGKGSRTNLRIDSSQSLNGHVLQSNNGTSEAMEKGVMTILSHYKKVDEYPQNQYCPGVKQYGKKFK